METTFIETQRKSSLRRVIPTEEVVDRNSQGSFQVASATNKPPSHKDLDVHCHNVNGITDEMFITIADSLHVWVKLHQKNVTLWLWIISKKAEICENIKEAQCLIFVSNQEANAIRNDDYLEN